MTGRQQTVSYTKCPVCDKSFSGNRRTISKRVELHMKVTHKAKLRSTTNSDTTKKQGVIRYDNNTQLIEQMKKQYESVTVDGVMV